MTGVDLSELVDRARVVLLDFDGPVCAVFAGHPAPAVARKLRQVLTRHGVALPPEIQAETDPMQVIRYAGTLGRPELAAEVDRELREAEQDAIVSAAPTPYGREAITAAHDSGRPVAIVSNNSAESVRHYLTAARLDEHIHTVIGRATADPARMKPDPAPVLDALAALDADPADAVFIGDTPADVDAGHAARVPVIGYANKPGKADRLAKADAIITSMADLAAALTPRDR